jgi:hypothetical protein
MSEGSRIIVRAAQRQCPRSGILPEKKLLLTSYFSTSFVDVSYNYVTLCPLTLTKQYFYDKETS